MHGIIFMTALVPHKGHEFLVSFASEWMASHGGKLHVVVSSLGKEPSITSDRINIMMDMFEPGINWIDHLDNNAPQNCKTDEDWDYWISEAYKATDGNRINFLFGSDSYCEEFAERLGAEWIPVDPARQNVPARGRNIRNEIFFAQDQIMNEWVRNKSFDVILFGQESVGKTTLASFLGESFWTEPQPEWARPYLEIAGPELTYQKMSNIRRGQMSQELSAPRNLVNVLDTDILSTYGYFDLLTAKMPPNAYDEKIALDDIYMILQYANQIYDFNRRIYLIPSDVGVPFEEDPLRYGGDKRETDIKFWTDLLDDFGAKYFILDGPTKLKRAEQAYQIVLEETGLGELINFEREEP